MTHYTVDDLHVVKISDYGSYRWQIQIRSTGEPYEVLRGAVYGEAYYGSLFQTKREALAAIAALKS